MKNTIKNLLAIVFVAFITFSFTAVEDKKEIKTSNSKVVWKGYKVTGSHEGTIAIKSGNLSFDGAKLVGGEFVMDMTTISFPTATLVFKDVKSTGKNSYEVTSDITIKGKTLPVKVTVSVYGSKANATLKIDRTKFDVRYGSTSFFDDLKNKAIYDDFDIIADLEF